MSFVPADAGADHSLLMHLRVLRYEGSASGRHLSDWRCLPHDSRGPAGLHGASAAWNITGHLLSELFPDLTEEYNDWHLTNTDP